MGFCTVEMLSSPKSQLREVIVPVEESVKETVKGAETVSIEKVKRAFGAVPAATGGLATLIVCSAVSFPSGPVTISIAL